MYLLQERRPRAVLLIDADNFKEETWLERAKQQLLEASGQAPVVRAYGAMSSLQARNGIWGRLAAEVVPNLSLEKNTTDASLIADASELCLKDGFRFFAIASGDADFAPLTVRLRRWGCEVRCFADVHTVFQDAEKYYDKVVRCEIISLAASRSAALSEPFILPIAADKVSRSIQVSMPTSSKIHPEKLGEMETPSLNSQNQSAQSFRNQVLNASPSLALGDFVALPTLICTLRKQGVIGKKEKLSSWASKLGTSIELRPKNQPNQIRLRKQVQQNCSADALPAREVRGLQRERSTLVSIASKASVLRSVLWEVLYRKISVKQVLAAVPELLDINQRFTVSSVASRLREKGLLATAHSLRKICDRYPEAFELNFDGTPQYIRYLG